MSNTPDISGFGKFVPGFDFLQNLAKQAAGGAAQGMPHLPNLGHWVAPTLNVEELDKRIEELKAVQFWLDQNAMALKATIQALEVQKMTLATLKGMNFNFGDVANAFKSNAATAVDSTAGAAVPKKTSSKSDGNVDAAPGGVIDPMQWWGALSQQFGQIAATAMKDAATQTAMDTTQGMAADLAKDAFKKASDMANTMTGGVTGVVTKAVTPSIKAMTKPKVAVAKKAAAKKRTR